jgi:hypothetical protein
LFLQLMVASRDAAGLFAGAACAGAGAAVFVQVGVAGVFVAAGLARGGADLEDRPADVRVVAGVPRQHPRGGLGCMLVSMVASVLLITDFLLSRPAAIVLSAVTAVWFLTLWVMLPFIRRNWGEQDPEEPLSADEVADKVRADNGR